MENKLPRSPYEWAEWVFQKTAGKMGKAMISMAVMLAQKQAHSAGIRVALEKVKKHKKECAICGDCFSLENGLEQKNDSV